MKRSKTTIFVVIVLLALGAYVGVRALPRTSTPTGNFDYHEFLARLSAANVTATEAGPVRQPFLSVEGKMVRAVGQGFDVDLQVYSYDDETALVHEREAIAADGRTIGTTLIAWIAPPHFFASDRVMILYLGNDPRVINVLSEVVSPQFAGASIQSS